MNRFRVEDLFEKVSALERKERSNADTLRDLQLENANLRRRVESTELKYDKLKFKFSKLKNNAGGRINADVESESRTLKELSRKYNELETIVRNMKEQIESFRRAQPSIQKLDSMTRILNRAMIQTQNGPHKRGEGRAVGLSPNLGSAVSDLLKWKKERETHDNQMLDKIRAVGRQTGCIDAIQDELSMLQSWKESKDEHDERIEKRLDENMKKINSNFTVLKDNLNEKPKEVQVQSDMPQRLQDQMVQTVDSIFCADLVPHDSEMGHRLEPIKINRTTAAFRSQTGPFDSQTGTFRAQHDGAYNLGWKIHQKGDGKIRYIMAIDGMKGRIYLGYTDEAGGMCTGSLVMPLKRQQRVWLEAKRVAGPDAQVYGCNFMGWLMELNSFGSLESIANLQQNLFSSIQNECQHL